MLSIVDIPGEVISHHLLGFLTLNELLRLRRVSHFTKSLVDDYIRLQIQSETEIIIADKDGYQYDFENDDHFKSISMSTLLEMEINIPTTTFTFIYPFNEINIFESEEWKMSEFVKRYGNQITHLKMSGLTVPVIPEIEIGFYENLPNLTHLTIENMDIAEIPEPFEYKFPSTFQNLKQFCLKNFYVIDNEFTKRYFWTLVEYCRSLEYLGQPAYIADNGGDDDDETTFGSFSFTAMTDLLTSHKLPLKFYDLDSMDENQVYSDIEPLIFAEFCGICDDHDVKLLNVNSELLYDLGLNELRTIAKSVSSMKGLTINSFACDFPLVEKMIIESSSCITRNENTAMFWEHYGPPSWPLLTSMDITINSSSLADGSPTHALWSILFSDVQRAALIDLGLRFEPFRNDDGIDLYEIPRPRSRSIISTCYNLKKLFICNWTGTNKAISILWTGLHLLEEVTFESCNNLGNVAFVGENKEKPTFLKLKNLKKFRLIALHQMQKITDTVFQLVFRHLKVREFYMDSLEEGEIFEIRSIKASGIKELLTGDFAKHIEKFPFDCWTLENVTRDELNDIRDQFRSTNLL